MNPLNVRINFNANIIHVLCAVRVMIEDKRKYAKRDMLEVDGNGDFCIERLLDLTDLFYLHSTQCVIMF